jgi:hypothetical protein
MQQPTMSNGKQDAPPKVQQKNMFRNVTAAQASGEQNTISVCSAHCSANNPQISSLPRWPTPMISPIPSKQPPLLSRMLYLQILHLLRTQPLLVKLTAEGYQKTQVYDIIFHEIFGVLSSKFLAPSLRSKFQVLRVFQPLPQKKIL